MSVELSRCMVLPTETGVEISTSDDDRDGIFSCNSDGRSRWH